MTLLELLAEVRRPFAQLLSTAIAGNAVFAEPALRTENGELAVDGLWNLPIRPDFIPRNGDDKSGMVDSKSRLDFEPFVVSYGACKVELAPFTWDWLSLTVDGLREDCYEELFRSWFLRWFDPEDTNEIGNDGLAGVVHYMSEPQRVGDKLHLTLDLGSAPPEALEQLLELLARQGAVAASVA